MKRFALLAAALPFLVAGLAACGQPQGTYLTDGTYQGTDRNGNEYTLMKQGRQVKLNYADTDLDDTKQTTAFSARFMPGKPFWQCKPVENGDAATCTVTFGSSRSTAVTIDLMKENE